MKDDTRAHRAAELMRLAMDYAARHGRPELWYELWADAMRTEAAPKPVPRPGAPGLYAITNRTGTIQKIKPPVYRRLPGVEPLPSR